MARPKEFDRTQVVKAAMDVFWLQGYEATSISDLTRATSLQPGSLYNTFGNKHALYLEALDYYLAHVGGSLFDVLDEPLPGLEAIERFFTMLIDVELNDTRRRGCFMQNAMMEHATSDPDVAQRACKGKEAGNAAFKRALQRAQAAGEIQSDLNLDQIASFLGSIVYAVRTASITTDDRAELEGIVAVALSVLR